jgi:hypothetical protein
VFGGLGGEISQGMVVAVVVGVGGEVGCGGAVARWLGCGWVVLVAEAEEFARPEDGGTLTFTVRLETAWGAGGEFTRHWGRGGKGAGGACFALGSAVAVLRDARTI